MPKATSLRFVFVIGQSPFTSSISCSAVFRKGRMNGQRGESDETRHGLAGEVEQALGPHLLFRFVDDPEENDPHLEEPEHSRQLRLDVSRDADTAVHQNPPEPGDINVANLAGVWAKGRERMLGVGPIPQKRPQNATVRLEMIELNANQLAQSRFKASRVAQSRLNPRLHLGARALVEVEDDGFLRRVVVIGGSGRHFGLPGDTPHGGAIEPLVAEEVERGMQNLEARFLGFGCGFRVRSRFEHVQEGVCAWGNNLSSDILNVFRSGNNRPVASVARVSPSAERTTTRLGLVRRRVGRLDLQFDQAGVFGSASNLTGYLIGPGGAAPRLPVEVATSMRM